MRGNCYPQTSCKEISDTPVKDTLTGPKSKSVTQPDPKTFLKTVPDPGTGFGQV